MRYAYVQILRPIDYPNGYIVEPCFIILEYFDDLKEIQEIHKSAPYQDRYIIIPVYS